jgi:hypothetical protein
MNIMYEITRDHGHYNVHINGKFYCSADNMTEAIKEVEQAVKATKEEQHK